MFDYIRISNFQSWKNIMLELHPNVNMFVGSSDVGKSALLRAIYWLCKNKPLGKEFISHWGGDALVEVGTKGIQIQRVKGKTSNYYQTNVIDSDKSDVYEAMRTHVPEDIIDILAVDDINFQLQHDNSFLLSNSSPEVARYLNNIVNLNVIDIALKNALKEKKECTNYLFNSKEQLKEVQGELEQYDWLEQADIDIQALQILQNQINDLEHKNDTLVELIYKIEKYEFNLKKYDWLEDAKKDIIVIDELEKEIDILENDYNYLENLIVDIVASENKTKQLKETLSAKDLIKETELLFDKNKRFHDKRILLSNIIKDITATEDKLFKFNEKIVVQKEKYNELMPDICPLCDK